MRLRQNWPAWACATAFGLQCALAGAQSRPDLPGRSNLQNTLPQAPPREPQRVRVPGAPVPGSDVRADTPVRPTEIRIAGVKSVPFGDVSAVFRGFVNTDTTVGALLDAARKVAGVYADHGYALSYAYLPQQDFAGGVVQVVAVEGYVDRLELEGAPAFLEQKIRDVAAPITAERPLTSRTFERYVSLLAKLPDVSVDADVPVPEGDDGASPLKLKVRQRRFTVSAAFDADHPGFEGLLTGNINGLTRLGDRLSASVMAPHGDRDRSYYELDYTLPLGDDGLGLHANAYRYRGRPSTVIVNGAGVRDDYDEARASVGLAYPFQLRADSEVSGEVALFAARSGDVFTDPGAPGEVDSRASTRGVQASLQGSWRGKDHETRAGAQLVKGFACCGANEEQHLVDLDFTKLRVSASRSDQWRHDSFGTFFSAVAQGTRDWLPVTERISFGGTYFGAGYPTGERAGDVGYGAAAELNKPFRRSGRIRRIEPYVGVDYAQAWLNGAAHPQALMSGIVGVRLDAGRHLFLNIGRAKPVGTRPLGEDGRPWRWNVQMSVNFG